MDLEQYGVWVKAGPEDVADDSEEMFTLSDVGDDIDESTFLQQNDLTAEEEDLLASLEEEPQQGPQVSDAAVLGDDSSLHTAGGDTQAAAAGEFSLDDLDDLDEFSLDDMTIPGDTNDSKSLDDLAAEFDIDDSAEDLPELDLEDEGGLGDIEDFDDISAVTEAMTEPAAAAAQPAAKAATAAGTHAAERESVAGIESELVSIKAELQALRRELAEFRSSGPSAAPDAPSQPRDSEEPEVTAGFFEEDEDETIALTDDELDNILNTAEFTEELGKPSEVDDVDEVDVDGVTDVELEPQSSDEASDFDAEAALNSMIENESTLESEASEGQQPEPGKPESPETAESAAEPDTIEADATDPARSTAAVDEIFLEELDDDEMLGADHNLEGAAEFEDDSLHQGDILAPSLEDEEITLEDDDQATLKDHDAEAQNEIARDSETEDQEPTSELFSGTDEDIDTLAAIDIDTELAEIDEMRAEADGDAEEVEPAEDFDSLDSIEIDVIGPEGQPDTLSQRVDAFDSETGEDTGAAEGEEQPLDREELALDLDDELGMDDELDLSDTDQDDTLTLDEEETLTPTFHAAETPQVDDEIGVDLDSGPEEAPAVGGAARSDSFPSDLREEIRSVLQYMDQLLESLPEEKIEEFARSEHFEVYRRLFEELGLDSPSAT